ncbi:MAG: lipase family protein [Candidatus Nitrosoglobus sp.]|jgi:hypothetical protein
MAAYTPIQIMLTLAFIADVGALIEEGGCNAENEVRNQIQQQLETLEPVKGNWKLVWGPSLFKFPLLAKYRDNTVYVVQSLEDKSQYVIAISGTNPYEITDWIFEDFLVAQTHPWQYGACSPVGARISSSAALSLAILQNLKPCQGIPGANLRLIDFLNSATNASSITVTGHSLGGEMASTAVLWLADTQGECWDRQNNAKLYAYCYAGATAGNSSWASYFHQQLGDRAHRIWNSLDVVPHAWQISSLKQIPDLYKPWIDPPFWAKPLLDIVIASVAAEDYTQIAAIAGDYQPLNGKVNTTPEWATFTSQVAYQHVNAYYELLNLPHLKALAESLRAKAEPARLL